MCIRDRLSGLPKISSNYQLIGNHVVIYKSPNNKFVWGIILREHEGGGPYYSSPVKTTVSLRGGDTLELATNELTISSNGIKATQKMKPSTIYLLEENLSVQECDNLSGVELVPRQVQDGGHDGEPPAGTYITVYDLKLPDDIYDRFKLSLIHIYTCHSPKMDMMPLAVILTGGSGGFCSGGLVGGGSSPKMLRETTVP